MKKILILFLIASIAVSCKKISKSPEGPTDVRIRNLTTLTMNNVQVSTGGGEYNFGQLKPDSVTVYHTFTKAYPKANISVIINNQRYKTDTIPNYAYMQYMGQMKITYEIFIENESQKKIAIYQVIPDEGQK